MWQVLWKFFIIEVIILLPYEYAFLSCVFYGLVYDLNSGPICNPGFVPITTSWQDCEKAATDLGYAGDGLAQIEPGGSFGTAKPPGCSQSDEDGLFYFNEDVVDTTAIGTDNILCVIKGSDHLPTVAPYIFSGHTIPIFLLLHITLFRRLLLQSLRLA